ncbi:unnamed protein product [Toxocara canis]|uniref:Sorting nexin-14 n=1 Tax=Toxocara canis TaxID=6265 RepID=A0A183ULE1_TOXCA|nr:unnamed protein product [Toxocara canis]
MADGEFLWNFFEFLLGEPLTLKPPSEGMPCRISKDVGRKMPWEGVRIPESVNESLEELVEQLIDSYINSWYKTEISNDTAYQIRYASAMAYRRIQKIDLSSLILSDAVPIAVVHAERVARIDAEIDKHVFPPQMVEMKILERMEDVHYALCSRQSEVNYLRQVADHLVAALIDESRVAGRASDDDSPLYSSNSLSNRSWPSHACRHFLRELIVFTFLIPILDLIADPDTINHLLILLFDPEPMDMSAQPQPKMVELLHGLTDCALSGAPDSLLQLKLSEILRDSRQLNMFTMYLKDVRGPTNELYFLLHSADVHERMLSIQKDDNALSELHYDVWEIFSKYVHGTAPERVALPEDVQSEFQTAVETRAIEALDRAIEKAFQIVYKRLQHDFVVPFCQSECYLGHLCGSPPVSVDELMFVGERSSLGRRLTLPGTESSFSLSQFRNRLWKALMPSSVDGSVDSSFDRLSDLGSVRSGSPNIQIELANDASAVAGSHPNPEYLVQFAPLPSIDVTCEEDPCTSTTEAISEVEVSPGSASNSEERIDRQSGCTSPYEMTMFDPHRDINRWMVTIPRIEPRRDPSNGRTMYVYIVCVERFDVNDNGSSNNGSHLCNETIHTNREWSVVRRYNEFYVLESKLLEFHGDLIKADPLPPRKPFATKSRAFIETQRPHFARFLQLLTRQSVLKRSDLLFTFLTSDRELKDNMQLSDLNPWNVVRKMPSKFTRERGQNLKPFLLSLLATTLAPQPEMGTMSFDTSRYSERSETRSLLDTLAFVFIRMFTIPRWFASLLISTRSLAAHTLDAAVALLLRNVLRIAFLESNCVRMVRLIQDSLFAADQLPSTEQEKALRAELAQRRTLEYLQEELPTHLLKAFGQKQFRQGVATLFRTLQYPRLNKQLSYVLLDVLVQKLLPVEQI